MTAGIVVWALLACITAPQLAADEVFQEPADFLAEVFDGAVPKVSRLWITNDLKAPIRAIMERDLGKLRLRYWRHAQRTAWILEEIGKDQPITTGVVVDDGQIADIRVLIYRESRGWEVRYPAFTDQFQGSALITRHELDRPIAGITGATLSVRALTRLARLALLLHEHSAAAD